MRSDPLSPVLTDFATMAREAYERAVQDAHETFHRRMQWLLQTAGAPANARVVGTPDGTLVAEWDDVGDEGGD